jgi:hypothetical protein
MGKLLVDLEVETGFEAHSGVGDGPYPVSCSSGRVIVAASAYANWPTNHAAIAATFSSGALTDTVDLWMQGSPGSISNPGATYYLTTAREVDLCE